MMDDVRFPKVKSWASILDPGTLEQARQSASLSIVVPHIALMPDAHLGYGAAVGSVIPTKEAIIPAAIGVDIGCGMNAFRTNIRVAELAGRDLGKLWKLIEQAVPLSAGNYNQDLSETAKDHTSRLESVAHSQGFDPADFSQQWQLQLGTLGGGNHFIEVVADDHDYVWGFLHTGSRGIGNRIATHLMKVAKELATTHGITVPHPDLSYLVEGTEAFDSYITQMQWAQDFAAANRAEIQGRLQGCLRDWLKADFSITKEVSCHHNYTALEEHFGQDLWISRKGAISAKPGELGLIPGSMGDTSYVVTGRGVADSFNSAPHGAGRVLSRNAARRKFTQADLRERMAGIEYQDSAAYIDEIPDAYKPIDQVMADAQELVQIQYQLRQLVNVKGA